MYIFLSSSKEVVSNEVDEVLPSFLYLVLPNWNDFDYYRVLPGLFSVWGAYFRVTFFLACTEFGIHGFEATIDQSSLTLYHRIVLLNLIIWNYFWFVWGGGGNEDDFIISNLGEFHYGHASNVKLSATHRPSSHWPIRESQWRTAFRVHDGGGGPFLRGPRRPSTWT